MSLILSFGPACAFMPMPVYACGYLGPETTTKRPVLLEARSWLACTGGWGLDEVVLGDDVEQHARGWAHMVSLLADGSVSEQQDGQAGLVSLGKGVRAVQVAAGERHRHASLRDPSK